MAEQYVVVTWPDGKTGAVLPKDFEDPKQAEYFEGATAEYYEDGTPYVPAPTRREERQAVRQDARRPNRRPGTEDDASPDEVQTQDDHSPD